MHASTATATPPRTRRILIWHYMGMLLSLLLAPTQGLAQKAIIELHPAAVVSGPIVHIQQIATVHALEPKLKRTIEMLDVDELALTENQIVISRDQVEARIALAHIPARDVRLVGVRSTRVVPTRRPDGTSSITAATNRTHLQQRPLNSATTNPLASLPVDFLEKLEASAADDSSVAAEPPPLDATPIVDSVSPAPQATLDQGSSSADSTEITAIHDAIVEFIKADLARRLNVPRHHVQAQILNAARKTLPPGFDPTTMQIQLSGHGRLSLGRRPLELAILQDGVLMTTWSGTVQTAAYLPLLVAQRRIAPGETITADSFEVEQRWSDKLEPIMTAAQVEGRTVTRAVEMGDILSTKLLARPEAAADQRPVLVKRNERVPVIVKGRTMSLQFVAVALQDGHLGDTIEVKNAQTNKQSIFGVVTADRTVEVNN